MGYIFFSNEGKQINPEPIFHKCYISGYNTMLFLLNDINYDYVFRLKFGHCQSYCRYFSSS